MKAKEYAELYRNLVGPWAQTERENGDSLERIHAKALADIYFRFECEIKPLVETRHVETNAGLAAIIKELDQKWHSFARLCPESGVAPEGFLNMLAHRIPETIILLREDARAQEQRLSRFIPQKRS